MLFTDKYKHKPSTRNPKGKFGQYQSNTSKQSNIWLPRNLENEIEKERTWNFQNC